MCYIGEIEAWMALLEEIKFFNFYYWEEKKLRKKFSKLLIKINSLKLRENITL